MADDGALLSQDKGDFQELTEVLIQETGHIDLKINYDKTKYMHLTRQDNRVCFDGHKFEQINQFNWDNVT